MPFERGEGEGPCDAIFVPGVDYVYVPHRRSDGNTDLYLHNMNSVTIIRSFLKDRCRGPVTKALCHFYLPPCGNSSTFQPPTSVCTEECNYVAELCPSDWERIRVLLETLDRRAFTFINCSNTGEYLDPLPYCCSDVGIDIRMYATLGNSYINSA